MCSIATYLPLLSLNLHLKMANRCSGCSQQFDLLPSGQRCGACVRRSSGQSTRWPQCISCGSVYEFLDEPTCAECIEFGMNLFSILGRSSVTKFLKLVAPQGTQDVAQDALLHPANPRTHSNHGRGNTGNDDSMAAVS